MFWFFVIVYGVACAVAAAVMAESRYRSAGLWAFLGFCFGLFTILVLAAIGEDTTARYRAVGNETGGRRPTLPPSSPGNTLGAPIPSPTAVQAGNWQSSSERRRWETLKEVDQDIAAAARGAAELGPEVERELAEKYLVLNDKSYLSALLERVKANAAEKAEQKRLTAEKAHRMTSEQSARIYRDFMREVEENGGVDPRTGEQIARVTEFTGRAPAFRGGIKIVLASGRTRLQALHIQRMFNSEAEADTWGS